MDTSKKLPLALSLTALAISVFGVALVLTGYSGNEEAPVPANREVFGQNSQMGYSAASRYGDLVWTAGHLPDPNSTGAPIGVQTDQVLTGLKRTLQQAGADFDTVVMTTVYLRDFNDWPAFNAAYRQQFTRKLPPRVTIQIGQLGRGDIEISMVAHVRHT